MRHCNVAISLHWLLSTEMKMIRSGYLLKEILDRFSSKIQRTLSPDRSLWMYFAHDTTIANMLNSLGLFEVIQLE